MNIKVSHKSAYGRDRFYPECKKAKILAQLAGSKTLTMEALDLIKAMDIKVEVIPAGKVVDI